MEPLHCLRRYPLFALLGTEKLRAWLECGFVQGVATGETVFQAGTAGTWAYLVLEGGVRVLHSPRKDRDVTLGVFGVGELFGEYALLPPHYNTATCRATRPSRLLRLPLLPLRQAFAKRPEVQSNLKNWLRLHVLVGYLRQRTFLGFMSATSSLPLLDRCRSVDFPAGHTLQADGLSDDRWYFVHSGEVRLVPTDARGEERLLGAGDCFGERALLGQEGLPAAVAVSDTRCLVLERSEFAPAESRAQPSLQSFKPRTTASRTYPWIGQETPSDCGLAALAMIVHWHGQSVSLEQLRRAVAVGEEGVTILDLVNVVRDLGLGGRAVYADPARLAEVALPAIAHLDHGHYVVVYTLQPEGVVVGDPASGLVTWSQELFRKSCSGNLLVFDREASAAAGIGRLPQGPVE
jgi:subfamily B ATP-binding cassette protein HlyB/CyaB